jgi:hypothetical protein
MPPVEVQQKSLEASWQLLLDLAYREIPLLLVE